MTGCAIDEDGAPKAGMGITAADIDDDGDLDVMVGNLNAESDSLFVNHGAWFEYATARLGMATVSRRFTRFGMAWHDFDNDGRLDLYQANGRVALQETSWGADDPYAEPDISLSSTSSIPTINPLFLTLPTCLRPLNSFNSSSRNWTFSCNSSRVL